MRYETQKILEDPTILVHATCVRVPVLRAHSEALNITFERDMSVEEAYAILKNAPGLAILEDRASNRFPMPIDAMKQELVYYGRIRKDPTHPNTLDLWVVDCAKAQYADAGDLFGPPSKDDSLNSAAFYFVREYVSRLAHPRDLRRVACDALRGRCAMRPTGQETKPGIWIEDDAEVHRRARIVAPAYIGRGTKVKEDTLITRCSTVERGCCVDAGTVIEDSSVLPNTHIGIWLDVCHAIASGNKLFSLERDVMVEISDSNVMRANGSARKEAKNLRALSLANEKQQPITAKVADSKKETPAPEAWQLGANPIQG